MAEEINNFNPSQDENLPQEENLSEKEDNRFPYESPKLRKHGKINQITLAVPVPGAFDNAFGPTFDIS